MVYFFLFFAAFLAFLATDKAIATDCFCDLPDFISFLMLDEMLFLE